MRKFLYTQLSVLLPTSAYFGWEKENCLTNMSLYIYEMHIQYVIWKCTYMGQNRCEIILHPCVHYIWSDFRNTLYIFIYDGKAKRFIYICVAAAPCRRNPQRFIYSCIYKLHHIAAHPWTIYFNVCRAGWWWWWWWPFWFIILLWNYKFVHRATCLWDILSASHASA